MTAMPAAPARFEIPRVIGRVLGVLRHDFLPAWMALLTLGLGIGVVTLLLVLATGSLERQHIDTGLIGILALLALWLGWLGHYAAGVTVMTEVALAQQGGQRPGYAALMSNAMARLLPVFIGQLVVVMLILAGWVLLVVPGVLAGVYLGIAGSARAAERIGWLAGLRRSITLTRDQGLGVFAVQLIFAAVGGILVVLALMLMGAGEYGNSWFSTGLRAGEALILAAALAIWIGATATSALFMMLSGAVPAAIYVELKRLKEGLDPRSIDSIFG